MVGSDNLQEREQAVDGHGDERVPVLLRLLPGRHRLHPPLRAHPHGRGGRLLLPAPGAFPGLLLCLLPSLLICLCVSFCSAGRGIRLRRSGFQPCCVGSELLSIKAMPPSLQPPSALQRRWLAAKPYPHAPTDLVSFHSGSFPRQTPLSLSHAHAMHAQVQTRS